MRFIPSGGLKDGRATKDRIDSRKSRAVRSIAVFEIFLDPSPHGTLARPCAGRRTLRIPAKTPTRQPKTNLADFRDAGRVQIASR
jgi:hypothetical protein